MAKRDCYDVLGVTKSASKDEIKKIKSESSDCMYWIKNANYVKLVIEESMRLFPPAYFMDRINHPEK